MAYGKIAKRYFPTATSRDFFWMMTGKKLGSGQNRDVYDCQMNSKFVIKLELRGRFFQNVAEYHAWKELSETDFGKRWLAPVYDLSANGIVLVQEKTQPIRAKDFPEELPACFRDVKLDNFGWLEDRIVCHDYGMWFNFDLRDGTPQKVNRDLLENKIHVSHSDSRRSSRTEHRSETTVVSAHGGRSGGSPYQPDGPDHR